MRFLLATVVAILLVLGNYETLEAKRIQLSPSVIEKAPILHRLIASGDIDELAQILPTMSKYLNDTTQDGKTALHWCVHCDNYEGAELLLESGADVNHRDTTGLTPLHESAKEGNERLTHLFLKNNADLELLDTNRNWGAFFWAVYSGNSQLVKRFLAEWQTDSQGMVDELGNDAIAVAAIAAAQQNNYDLTAVIQTLIDSGVRPDTSKALLYIPLEEVEAITLLLENNANPNAADTHGVTPLMRAAAASNLQAVELFLEHKADVNIENSRRLTALNLVDMTKPEREDIIKLLLSKDIDTSTPSIGMFFNNIIRYKDKNTLKFFLEKLQDGSKDSLKKVDPSTIQDQELFDLLDHHGLIANDDSSSTSTQTKSSNISSKKRATRVKMPDFLRDLNALAKDDALPKLIGRQDELDNVIRSLGRKVKNNPLLIGEAGVGKTAIVEGLVQRVVAGQVPEWLKDKSIYTLDMNALVSDIRYEGELQKRVKNLVDFASGGDAILFIDEIHMIVGAGGSQMSVANALKQALARGDISCIGATTHNEYQRYFARDQALERRFLPIRIDEPSLDETLQIVQGIKGDYEKFHDIEITNDSMTAVVEFANQYIPERYFPDKALDVLDASLAHLKMVYDLAADKGEDMERVLTREMVADSLSKAIGVSKDKMMQSRQESLVNLVPWLENRIFGQSQAIEAISDTMQLANSGLKSHLQEGEVLSTKGDSPIASMLFNGPTGVGKTETAKLLSDYLYNSNLIKLDMSEYSEGHSTSKLIGSPPGYVGHNEGGFLTSAVRKNPHSVVLFDEMDKAHPAVHNSLLQILSEGQLTDGQGNEVSFKNTVVILTSNSASSSGGGGAQKRIGFKTDVAPEKFDSKKINISTNILGRLDNIVTFKPIDTDAVDKLLEKELKELNLNLQSKEVNVALSDAATEHLYKNALNPELGARSVHNAFAKQITLVIAKKLIKNELDSGNYQIDFDGEEYSVSVD